MSQHSNHSLQGLDYIHQFHAKMIEETRDVFQGNESHVLYFSGIKA